MPRYEVNVAHRDTGAELTLTLNADSSSDAAEIANQHSFLVREIVELQTTPPPPAIHPLDSEELHDHICDIARQVLNDHRFNRKLRRTINAGVWQGVVVGLFIFIVVLPILIFIASLLGYSIGSGIRAITG